MIGLPQPTTAIVVAIAACMVANTQNTTILAAR